MVSDRGQRCVHVRENDEDLVEPRDFENRPDVILQTRQDKFSSVSLDVLHSFDQHREPRAIDVSHGGKVDHEARRLLLDHRAERGGHAWRDVQVDFAVERQNVGSVGQGHTVKVWEDVTLPAGVNRPPFPVIPSAVEESRLSSFKVARRDLSTSLEMTTPDKPLTPAESPNHFVHIREIIKKKVGPVFR